MEFVFLYLYYEVFMIFFPGSVFCSIQFLETARLILTKEEMSLVPGSGL